MDTLDVDKFRRGTRIGDFSRAWKGILAAETAGHTHLNLATVSGTGPGSVIVNTPDRFEGIIFYN